jgi:hypothetical protein
VTGGAGEGFGEVLEGDFDHWESVTRGEATVTAWAAAASKFQHEERQAHEGPRRNLQDGPQRAQIFAEELKGGQGPPQIRAGAVALVWSMTTLITSWLGERRRYVQMVATWTVSPRAGR